MTLQSFQELIVWQKSMALAKNIYTLTKSLPSEEKFGLINQMRRCAVSIPSNIAEGTKRGTRKDYLQFLRIASGSAAELQTQLFLVRDIFGLEDEAVFSLLGEVQRMLTTLTKRIASPLQPITSNL